MKFRNLLLVLSLVLLGAGAARADIDAYLNSLTAYASADLGWNPAHHDRWSGDYGRDGGKNADHDRGGKVKGKDKD